jgi:hypothetical protein
VTEDVNTIVEAVKKLYGIDDERFSTQGHERVISEARSLAAWAGQADLTGQKYLSSLDKFSEMVYTEPSLNTVFGISVVNIVPSYCIEKDISP